jgi:hypothetical protein
MKRECCQRDDKPTSRRAGYLAEQQKEGKAMPEATKMVEQSQPSKSRQSHRISNAIFLKIAGGPLRAYSRLTHIGRVSGREYVTPLSAYPLGDGFVMAVLYGEAATVDWCRNVMAAGRCTLKTHGQVYQLMRPEIVSADIGLAAYPTFARRMYRARGIREFLWVHRK